MSDKEAYLRWEPAEPHPTGAFRNDAALDSLNRGTMVLIQEKALAENEEYFPNPEISQLNLALKLEWQLFGPCSG